MPTTGRAPRSDEGEPVDVRRLCPAAWNVTGLFLEAGTTYRFTATGQWLDGSVPCGPGGAQRREVPDWRARPARGTADRPDRGYLARAQQRRAALSSGAAGASDGHRLVLRSSASIANRRGRRARDLPDRRGHHLHAGAQRLSLRLCQRRLGGLWQQPRQRPADGAGWPPPGAGDCWRSTTEDGHDDGRAARPGLPSVAFAGPDRLRGCPDEPRGARCAFTTIATATST